MTQVYLGDGAYARDGCYAGEVVLYTSNGYDVTNTVVLEPTAVEVLVSFLAVRFDGLEEIIDKAKKMQA